MSPKTLARSQKGRDYIGGRQNQEEQYSNLNKRKKLISGSKKGVLRPTGK
jgi:hypothetical protein